jgi:hypothetical protein
MTMWKMLCLAIGLLGAPLEAQASVDLRGLERTWMELGPATGGRLDLDLSAGGIAIRPSEDGRVRVRGTSKGDQDLSRVQIRFASSGGASTLKVSHTPNNNFQMEIQVPRSISLSLRMTAGQLTLEGVEGDKDLRLHAGQLIVQVGDPAGYGPVSASVWAGEVRPGPFGDTKGGLFRSFRYEGKGSRSLQASVKAGEVTFRR